jgi:hypothetical protein
MSGGVEEFSYRKDIDEKEKQIKRGAVGELPR